MFCVMWFDTASSSSDAVPASVAHSSCRADASAAPRRCAGRRAPSRLRSGVRFRSVRLRLQRRPAAAAQRADEQRRSRPTSRAPAFASAPRARAGTGSRRAPASTRGSTARTGGRARAGTRAREPRLHQRARRRQQEVRQADRRREQPRISHDGFSTPVGFQCTPGTIGSTASDTSQQRDVHADLHARREADARRDRSTRSRRAASPGRTRGTSVHTAADAAEPRQDLLRHHRLDEEQQERADEYGCGVEEHRDRRGRAAARREGATEPAHSTDDSADDAARGDAWSPETASRDRCALSTWSAGGSTRCDRSSGPRAP